ncbi:hypothetical protein [Luteibacter yeojuensis]|uniref:Uncharacterized protein n=1 Tax=Luteibacter yeojuensis TaxID=345309 RepID=A0A0F3KZL7_9GAMM|nr:hypothetical protein [Luteibacter yeojuensis]KJV36417.1 hypothetical protein VI08_04650 [Luteibacter yeojuensis]
MIFFRKSLATELTGRAERLAGAITHDRTREASGAVRQYAGHAGVVASRAATRASKQATRAAARAGKQLRSHPRGSIAVGAGLGVAAITAAWLLRRYQHKQHLASLEHDEHDPTRYRATNAAGDALDGTGEDNPVPGESGVY